MEVKKVDKSAGFTLIELLVVIAIIGFLATAATVSLQNARIKARDAKRKADLKSISVALELYYNTYGLYPSTGATVPNANATYSRQASWLLDLLNAKVITKAPVDPINIDRGPWCWGGLTNQNTIYTYASDGVRYILCSWLENGLDNESLEFKDVQNPWNAVQYLHANYNYSAYNYVIAK